MIYQWEASGDAPDAVAAAYWSGPAEVAGGRPADRDEFAEELLFGVARRKERLDELIREHSANWRLERMSAVDRGILRLASYELQAGETPAAVVIDEAIELGRRYSGEESAKFLNGVLDAIRKRLFPDAEAPSAAPD